MTNRSPQAWLERGTFIEVPEGPVFAIELGGNGDGRATPVLVLHGFPTSSWDFVDVATRGDS